MLLDLGYKIIIIEVDENRHDSYTTECETARLNDISTDLNYRPVVMIRFNPDGYTTTDNVKITSPWAVNGTTKLYSVKKTRMAEWNTRLERLTAALDYHVNTENTELITIEELYY